MTEVPYAYLLCISEYSGVKPWKPNYTGCGMRIGEQSGRIYPCVTDVADWTEYWPYQHRLDFLR